MKFEVGDRIVFTVGSKAREEFQGQRGTIVGLDNSLFLIEFDNEITRNGKTKRDWRGTCKSAILESVYDSPLYQALL